MTVPAWHLALAVAIGLAIGLAFAFAFGSVVAARDEAAA